MLEEMGKIMQTTASAETSTRIESANPHANQLHANSLGGGFKAASYESTPFLEQKIHACMAAEVDKDEHKVAQQLRLRQLHQSLSSG